jgi:nicotinamidase-related amidase
MRALMVIDVQQGLFETEQPHDSEAVVGRIAGLIARARAAKAPLFFVQHDGGPGDELDRNGPGFAFRSEVAPQPGDSVIVKRRCNAFQDTDLDDRLKALGIDEIVVCGMQTEFCVDTTVRAAFERGYHMLVACDAHTTFDSSLLPADMIIAHTHHIWNGRFAKLKKADEIRFMSAG